MALEAPDVPGAFSQTRRLDQAAEAMIDAIAGVLDVDPSTVQVDIRPIIAEHSDLIAEADHARHDAEMAQRTASKLSREVASVLAADGLSMRDIGFMLGISHQRAQQLLNS